MLPVYMPVFSYFHMKGKILKTNVNMFCFTLGHPGGMANSTSKTFNYNNLVS